MIECVIVAKRKLCHNKVGGEVGKISEKEKKRMKIMGSGLERNSYLLNVEALQLRWATTVNPVVVNLVWFLQLCEPQHQ